MGSRRGVRNTLSYLILHLPLYLTSGYFRLGTLTLSCIFYGYWTILPVFLLFISLYRHAYHEMQFSVGESGVLAISNLFVVSLRQNESLDNSFNIAYFRSAWGLTKMILSLQPFPDRISWIPAHVFAFVSTQQSCQVSFLSSTTFKTVPFQVGTNLHEPSEPTWKDAIQLSNYKHNYFRISEYGSFPIS